MLWEGKPWHGLSYELKSMFGEKVIKLSVDGGFTCPNRDGTLGYGGCSFCGDDGSGSHAGEVGQSIPLQILQQRTLLSKKWGGAKSIVYFQNFTGTYGDPARLAGIYNEALNADNIIGIAIATRPDCLSDEVLKILEELQKKTFLWVELGLQTVHDETAVQFGRGYTADCFFRAFDDLKKRGIPTVVHLINGLPGEGHAMMLESARVISELQPWGMKLHLLHVIKGTQLERTWAEGRYTPLEMNEYVMLIADQLEILSPDITIHRLTGDGTRDTLLAPKWSLDKKGVLGAIEMEMRRRNSWQGKKCHPME